jgi:hypothetical protein
MEVPMTRDKPPKEMTPEESRVYQAAKDQRMADAARLFDAVRNRPMLPPDTMTLTNNPTKDAQ